MFNRFLFVLKIFFFFFFFFFGHRQSGASSIEGAGSGGGRSAEVAPAGPQKADRGRKMKGSRISLPVGGLSPLILLTAPGARARQGRARSLRRASPRGPGARARGGCGEAAGRLPGSCCSLSLSLGLGLGLGLGGGDGPSALAEEEEEEEEGEESEAGGGQSGELARMKRMKSMMMR